MKSSVTVLALFIVINASIAFPWGWSSSQEPVQLALSPEEPVYDFDDNVLHMPLIPRLEHLERLILGYNLDSKVLTKSLEILEEKCVSEWKGHGTIEQRFKRLLFNVKNMQKELYDVELKLFGTHNTESIQARIKKILSNGFADIKGENFLVQIKNIKSVIIGEDDSSEQKYSSNIASNEVQTKELLVHILNMLETQANQKNHLEIGDTYLEVSSTVLELD